jgi:hypothetical protein
MYILLNGTGVGFSVETPARREAPARPRPTSKRRHHHHRRRDSKEGWAEAFRDSSSKPCWAGLIPDWDLSADPPRRSPPQDLRWPRLRPRATGPPVPVRRRHLQGRHRPAPAPRRSPRPDVHGRGRRRLRGSAPLRPHQPVRPRRARHGHRQVRGLVGDHPAPAPGQQLRRLHRQAVRHPVPGGVAAAHRQPVR